MKSSKPLARSTGVLYLAVVSGVVLALAGAVAVATSWSLLAGLLGIAAGLTLIVTAAAALGRTLGPALPQGGEGGGQKPSYPARLTGQLDPELSRGMWLVKWILAIPHCIVLAVLWIAFIVVTVAAGVAILFTGRYPVSLFQFSVGVLRWNWRVAYYAYSVLGTDRYPPFTLAHSDYPATFDVMYPTRLSNWQVLVKSWLFALPHLLIIGALTTGTWASSTGDSTAGISLLGLLVLITAVILLFTGGYRLGLFNLLMGLNRWIYRTMAYTALMTDTYPPFRLDQGPTDDIVRDPSNEGKKS